MDTARQRPGKHEGKQGGKLRGLSLSSFILIPLCLALLIQVILSVFVLVRGDTFRQMDADAYDLFEERVSSRAGYLENDMIFRWSDVNTLAEGLSNDIAGVLAQNGVASSELTASSPTALAAIEETSDTMIAFTQRAEVDGVFLVLADANHEANPTESAQHAALYVRDSNPQVDIDNNSDLQLAACPISLGRELGLALDSQWSATFDLAAEGDPTSSFFWEPLRAAQHYPDAVATDLGYWGHPADLGWAGTPSITYSIPLLDDDGGVMGVLGVEVHIDRVTSFFPYQDLGEEGAGSYVLAVTSEEGGFARNDEAQPQANKIRTYQVLAATGATQSLYVTDGSFSATLNEQGYPTIEKAEGAAATSSAVAAVSEIKLNDTTSPFASEHWVLVGIESSEVLFSPSHQLFGQLLGVFLISLIVGVAIAALFVWFTSSRLSGLMAQVGHARFSEDVSFEPTRIREVDKLADSVEMLSREVLTSRHRAEFERDHDILTGLLSRRAFDQKATRMLERGNLPFAALLMIDLDNLKFINDTYGHDWGDQYIKAAGIALDTSFAGHGFSSRISGDEFLVMLHHVEGRDEAIDLFERFRSLLNASVINAPDGKTLKVRASMGAAFYPEDASDFSRLREYADFAMYLAKNSRKGELCLFDRTSYDEKSYMLSNREELNRLLEEELVDYSFQPIVDMRAGEVVAYEALMRPRLETIDTPDKVISLARAQSKLYQVERLTFFSALSAYRSYLHSGSPILFINSIATQRLSAEDEELLSTIYGDTLSRVVIEITESDYSREMAVYKEALARRFGARLAIDDFGSGYNGETSLLDYHADFVKLDIGIVRNIDKVKDRRDIAKNLINYAHERGILVIAEGVESKAELREVAMLGADFVQGYLVGYPEPTPVDISEETKQLIRSLWSAGGSDGAVEE